MPLLLNCRVLLVLTVSLHVVDVPCSSAWSGEGARRAAPVSPSKILSARVVSAILLTCFIIDLVDIIRYLLQHPNWADFRWELPQFLRLKGVSEDGTAQVYQAGTQVEGRKPKISTSAFDTHVKDVKRRRLVRIR
ncbi:Hypp5835 [Branchiostoma lanceolatum]|uniref:Hypp5835 protein n=1 Tax=Branchiostoma lanceolatum TaxID=7740 RepID=A0A8J9YMH5_BRALA|nr:Hypp5835 [Branchiostoma lanceolatum]